MNINALLNDETRAGEGDAAPSHSAALPAAAAVAPAPSSSTARDSSDHNTTNTAAHDDLDIQQAASLLATLSGPPAPSSPPSHAPSAVKMEAQQPNSADIDHNTALAIQNAQNEYSTRRREPKAMSPPQAVDSPAPSTNTTTPAPKKRPPKSASRAKTADGSKKPPPSKKRKMDDTRSATPSSTSGKKSTAKPRKQSTSATPVDGPSPEAMLDDEMDEDDNGSVEDENAVYCICRKPDNHTWMIGCDGGCDDWYHGKCVNMQQEDEGLIDKFICPICMDKTGVVTTWKPMCRYEGCRNPARLKKGSESKYCSDKCGELFMMRMLKRAPSSRQILGKTIAERRKSNQKPLSESTEDADVGPLGGQITSTELKSLVVENNSSDGFRNVGDIAALTPPDSATAEEHDKDQSATIYEPYEQARLEEISTLKAKLYDRRMLLKARSKFVMMARDRASRMRQANKDACHFDPRLAHDDRRFSEWAESDEGRAALEKGVLDDPKPRSSGDDEAGESDDLTICSRRRCKKHSEWQKIALHDVRFEEAEVGDEMRGVDAEETALKQAGMMRARQVAQGVPDEGSAVEAVDQEMIDAP